jgi:hypothetical protein
MVVRLPCLKIRCVELVKNRALKLQVRWEVVKVAKKCKRGKKMKPSSAIILVLSRYMDNREF